MTGASKSSGTGSKALQIAAWLGWTVLRGAWISLMVLVPLFGFWLASSLAAYNNASQWLALLVGLLLFPLVPVGWDLFFVWRRSKSPEAKAILTRIDRLVLRTLLVNGVFLVGMMWFARGNALRALSVRGDWMLDGHDGGVASSVRGALLGIADRLERRFGKHAPEADYGESDAAPDPSKIKERKQPERKPPPSKRPEKGEPEPTTPAVPPKDEAGWPMSDAPDPAVANMPEDAQKTIATVGAYLKDHFPDKKQRVKAIHDFIVIRLRYDEAALRNAMAGNFDAMPSQKAEDVFAARTGVCEGYARLMVAIGKAANVEIMYVVGHIRDAQRRMAGDMTDEKLRNGLGGLGHAWNAVLIDDEWQLIDTTWDDPTGKPEDNRSVRSTYLFTPPKLFAYDHLPEDPAWQLVVSPLSAGDFARQPLLSPEIGRYGLQLESPTRSQISVSGEAKIVLDNPYAARVSAYAVPDGGGGKQTRCEDALADGKTTITCDLDAGEFEIRMFATYAAQPGESGSYRLQYIGSILANSR